MALQRVKGWSQVRGCVFCYLLPVESKHCCLRALSMPFIRWAMMTALHQKFKSDSKIRWASARCMISLEAQNVEIM